MQDRIISKRSVTGCSEALDDKVIMNDRCEKKIGHIAELNQVDTKRQIQRIQMKAFRVCRLK